MPGITHNLFGFEVVINKYVNNEEVYIISNGKIDREQVVMSLESYMGFVYSSESSIEKATSIIKEFLYEEIDKRIELLKNRSLNGK